MATQTQQPARPHVAERGAHRGGPAAMRRTSSAPAGSPPRRGPAAPTAPPRGPRSPGGRPHRRPRTRFPGGNPFTAEALAETIPDLRDRAVFICGPTALQARVTSELRRAGVPAGQIHTERFAW